MLMTCKDVIAELILNNCSTFLSHFIIADETPHFSLIPFEV